MVFPSLEGNGEEPVLLRSSIVPFLKRNASIMIRNAMFRDLSEPDSLKLVQDGYVYILILGFSMKVRYETALETLSRQQNTQRGEAGVTTAVKRCSV